MFRLRKPDPGLRYWREILVLSYQLENRLKPSTATQPLDGMVLSRAVTKEGERTVGATTVAAPIDEKYTQNARDEADKNIYLEIAGTRLNRDKLALFGPVSLPLVIAAVVSKVSIETLLLGNWQAGIVLLSIAGALVWLRRMAIRSMEEVPDHQRELLELKGRRNNAWKAKGGDGAPSPEDWAGAYPSSGRAIKTMKRYRGAALLYGYALPSVLAAACICLLRQFMGWWVSVPTLIVGAATLELVMSKLHLDVVEKYLEADGARSAIEELQHCHQALLVQTHGDEAEKAAVTATTEEMILMRACLNAYPGGVRLEDVSPEEAERLLKEAKDAEEQVVKLKNAADQAAEDTAKRLNKIAEALAKQIN